MENSIDGASVSVIKYNELSDSVKRLESRLYSLEQGRGQSMKDTSTWGEADEGSSHGDDSDHHQQHQTYQPRIRLCNYDDFKNIYDDQDANCCVDVLESGPLCDQEHLTEERLRTTLSNLRLDGSSNARRKAIMAVREAERSIQAMRNEQQDQLYIHRIRIQAPILLDVLSGAHNESWPSTKPRTYERPFCTLLYYLPQAETALKDHHERYIRGNAEYEMLLSSDPAPSTAELASSLETLDELRGNTEILRAYVDFMKKRILAFSESFRSMDFKDDGRIRFSDLCYLFAAGDFLHRPSEGERLGETRNSRVGERIWRIISVSEPTNHRHPLYAHEQPGYSSTNSSDPHADDFVVSAYHIDYNGDEVCIVQHSFSISPFFGQRRITNLPFYPQRFAHEYKTFVSNAENTGNKVLEYIKNRHAFYDDWSVTRSPQDNLVVDENGKEMRHPEYIHSEVMVDFREAFQFCPTWQPARTILVKEAPSKAQMEDAFGIRKWSGRDRARTLGEFREILPFRTGVHALQRNKFIETDPFLILVAKNDSRGEMTTIEELGAKEKILLHCRVFAYIFRERKFAQINANSLKRATASQEALDALKIDSGYKRVIQRSVQSYFMEKRHMKAHNQEDTQSDVISGKGGGLFILCHGPPGVGKTMTAEAVARANGKPLFKITCGDIGLTPTEVESSLRRIFRLASIWDCILLMDEVDTFFSQRSRSEGTVDKNALVSVFLRILDYYNGVLFLTTNRPGTLDEAFKSRIHYKFLYTALTESQTLEIWRYNIERVNRMSNRKSGQRALDIQEHEILEYARTQYRILEDQRHAPWSGRQIRNAFQVARSLACYDAADSDNGEHPLRPATLNCNYFKMMHSLTQQFDEYMKHVHAGQDDAALARHGEIRADGWQQDRSGRTRRTATEQREDMSTTDFLVHTLERDASANRSIRPSGHRLSQPQPPPAMPFQPRTNMGLSIPTEERFDDNRMRAVSPTTRQQPFGSNDPSGSPQDMFLPRSSGGHNPLNMRGQGYSNQQPSYPPPGTRDSTEFDFEQTFFGSGN